MKPNRDTLANFVLRFLRLGLQTSTAVVPNLAASAIETGHPEAATVLTGIVAACLAGQQAADHGLSSRQQPDEVTRRLCTIAKEVGSLHGALEALASKTRCDPHLSEDRARQLLCLVNERSADLSDLATQHSEILFTMVRWLEAWQDTHSSELALLIRAIVQAEQRTAAHMAALSKAQREDTAAHVTTHDQLARIEGSVSELAKAANSSRTASRRGRDTAAQKARAVGSSSRRTCTSDMSRFQPLEGSPVGRETDLRKLDATWQQHQTRVLNIVGTLGVGKSTLVQRWLAGLDARGGDTAERLFYWPFASDSSAVDRFFDEALKWFGDGGMPLISTRSKCERLAALIQRHATIFVLDGVEALQQATGPDAGRIVEPGVAALICLLASNRNSLCVVTSRRLVTDVKPFLGVSASQFELLGLTPKLGAKLFRSLGVSGSTEDLMAASEELHGNPMAIELLAGYLVELLKGDVRRRAEARLIRNDIAQGDRVRLLMEEYESRLSRADISALQVLSLFDRPARVGELDVIRSLPIIPHLTEGVAEDNEKNWLRALAAATRSRLIRVPDSGTVQTVSINPLAREHFRGVLRERAPLAWREANRRLHEYYSAQCVERPRTILDLMVAVTAVVYGCRAGKPAHVLEKVFLPHIRQGDRNYSVHRLGAISTDLVALSEFFEMPWAKPHRDLPDWAQAYVLKEAAFSLNALGWPRDAVAPMRSALLLYESQKEWEKAAGVAGSLSGIYVALGRLKEAEEHARRGLQFADLSQSWHQRITRRASLAHALYQTGHVQEATALFAESEQLQQQEQPQSPLLYAKSGFLYCQLLLDRAEAVCSTKPGEARSLIDQVRARADSTMRWYRQDMLRGPTLSDAAFDHLTLGRVGICLAMLGDAHEIGVAGGHINAAIEGLQNAGTDQSWPAALLVRAMWHLLRKDFGPAQTDIAATLRAAQLHGMLLQEADAHLEQCRLALVRADWRLAMSALRSAKEIAVSTGYKRRDATITALGHALSRSSY